jgi:hypothetical protein
MELIRIKKESLERAGIPFKPGTLYKWKSIGKYPEMFTMIGDNLFVIKERWEKMVSEAIIKTDQRVAQIKKLKES